MSDSICPYCKHKSTHKNIALGSVRLGSFRLGAKTVATAIGVAVAIIPGAGILLGLTLGIISKFGIDHVTRDSDKRFVTCPNCGKDYDIPCSDF